MPLGPNDKADAQRFAVTWDGLVYPIVTVGKPANLKADVEAHGRQIGRPWMMNQNYRIQEFDDESSREDIGRDSGDKSRPPMTMRQWTEASFNETTLGQTTAR